MYRVERYTRVLVECSQALQLSDIAGVFCPLEYKGPVTN